MNTYRVIEILGKRRTAAIGALACGSLLAGIAAWDAFTTPIQWSPHSSSVGGWYESPALDSMNDSFNHGADLIVWFLGCAVHVVAVFVRGAIVFGLGLCVLDASLRFARWFTANFRLA